jgi:ribonuclease E
MGWAGHDTLAIARVTVRVVPCCGLPATWHFRKDLTTVNDMPNDGLHADEPRDASDITSDTPTRQRRGRRTETAAERRAAAAAEAVAAEAAAEAAAAEASEEEDTEEEAEEYDSGSTFDADAFEGTEPIGLPRSGSELDAMASTPDAGEGDAESGDRRAAYGDEDGDGDAFDDGYRAASAEDHEDAESDDDGDDDEQDSDDDSDDNGDDDGDEDEASADGSASSGAGDRDGEGDDRRGRRRRRRGRGRDRDRDGEPQRRTEDRRVEVRQEDRRGIRQLMVVNDVPEDECRIAILENGRVEALFMERYGAATNVGNIYKGRVTNVEPAIQAAFVDFGEGASGFLHVSDLHPKYFPGRERTERVGRKIPRRERPLIQEALRKGQEVLVQVLKEGISNKGPTLTSYLSIPGRLMVMMPDMDRVGVSRKVEDEDQRRAMRKILDQLDLPEGFGFILRTAGFDKTKTELQRDLAYLTRLWAVMKKRMDTTGAPCLLYSEGDLLIRTIRDLADENVEGIVVDSEDAFRKATAFLQVVSPRSAPRVLFWDQRGEQRGPARPPVFHAFDIERQIHELHSRIVPLPSGGALVIDQTEALVAIDVNSGRSRSARDSETNAYQTNVEAVEEIARQLRLRDLGGVIVNDLIDMRSPRHRREIEDRFRNALKRDRAKSTIVPISEFGVLEMTRQRMRPSVRRAHFMDCPHCQGLGEVRKPETVAADHLRQVEFLLTHTAIHRVEMVCSVRVATVLLSTKRRALYDLERNTGKHVDVRISEAIPIDRVDLYAYDERGADVELDRIPRPARPHLDQLPLELPERAVADDFDDEDDDEGESERGGGRRRRRRRRKPQPADTTAMILSGTFDDLPDAEPDDDEPTIAEAIAEERRQRREEEKERQRQLQQQKQRPARPEGAEAASDDESSADRQDEEGDEGGGRRRRRRRRRGRAGRDGEGQPAVATPAVEAAPPPPPPPPSEPMAVFALAKELGVPSKEILTKLADQSIEVKSHMSKLTGEQVDIVKAWYAPPPPPPPPPAPVASRAVASDRDADDGDETEGPGEGGVRRKRRRRRRRGRGRDGEFPRDGDQPGDEGEPPFAGASGSDEDEGPREVDGTPSSAPFRGGEDTGDEEGEGGGRRRRRRRRRGRGGDRDRDPNAPRSAPPTAGANPSAPPRSTGPSEGRDRGPGRDRRDDRPFRGRREQEGGREQPRPAAPAPEPKPDAMPQPPAIPMPRSLYGGRIRRLSGGAKGAGGGGGDDE